MIHRAPTFVLAETLLSIQGCRATTVPASDHFSGSPFHNRGNAPGYSLWDEMRIGWELRTKKQNWPARFETKPYAAPAEPVLNGIRVLWVGHSTTLIQTPHLNVLTDPILFDSIGPGIFGLNTVTNPALIIESLPRIDVILISHNHYDHLDVRSLRALLDRQRTAPPMMGAGRASDRSSRAQGFHRIQNWIGTNL